MKLKPCPFCGSTRLESKAWSSDVKQRVSCLDCDAHGPWEWNEESSFSAWNERADETKVE